MFYFWRFCGFAGADADWVSLLISVVCCLGVSALPVSIRCDKFAADAGEDADARRVAADLNRGSSGGERDGDTDCTRFRPLFAAPRLLLRGVVTALCSLFSSCSGATGELSDSTRGDATGVVGAEDDDAREANELDVGTVLGDAN